jgi:hypothetical protein
MRLRRLIHQVRMMDRVIRRGEHLSSQDLIRINLSSKAKKTWLKRSLDKQPRRMIRMASSSAERILSAISHLIFHKKKRKKAMEIINPT